MNMIKLGRNVRGLAVSSDYGSIFISVFFPPEKIERKKKKSFFLLKMKIEVLLFI